MIRKILLNTDWPRLAERALMVSCLLLSCCSGGGGGQATIVGGGGGGADLRPSSVSIDLASVPAGGQVQVTDVVVNDGEEDAASFSVGIFLSADAFITTGDVQIGSRLLSRLDAGTSSQAQGLLTVPLSTPAGTYHVGAIVDPAGHVAEAEEANNVLAASATLEVSGALLSDLAATQVSFSPAEVDAGTSLHVSDAVQNLGVASSGSFQVGIYLSEDAVVTTADTLIGLRSIASLSVGGISLVDDDLLVPTSVAEGFYHLGAFVDVGGTETESDEFNNSLIATGQLRVRRPPQPDLVVSAVSFTPFAVEAGQTIEVNETVVNQGTQAAGPFRVGVFLSTDGEVTDEDELIAFRSVAGLDIGATSQAAASIQVPAEVGEGLHTLGVIVDYERALSEEHEDNNTTLALGSLDVSIPPLPDLRATSITYSPSSLEEGEDFTVTEGVTNAGTAAAGAFRIGTYLSQNSVISTSDVLLGTRSVTGLALGASSEETTVYSLPPGVAAGSWYVGVIVDDLMQQTELSEGNNSLLSSGVVDVIAAPDPHPDLVVSALSSAELQVLPGEALQLVNTVRNDGDLSAPSFLVAFYLSEDGVLDDADVFLGERTIFSLGIGFASAQSFPYTVPSDTPVGFYHLAAHADRLDVVAEHDEDNNILVTTARVEVYVPPPPQPDLVVTAVDFTPPSAAPGETVHFTVSVSNDGDAAAGTTRVAVYLSEDSEVTTDDTLLGRFDLTDLGAGANSTRTVGFELPAGLAAGDWFLEAIVDDEDLVLESDENNNALAPGGQLEVL